MTSQLIPSSNEKDLKKIFADLLIATDEKGSDVDYHPSFARILEELTADEARMIRYISTLDSQWPCWNDDLTGNDLWVQLRKDFSQAGLAYPDKLDIYVDNLLRLRILRYFTSAEAHYQAEGGNEDGDWGASVTTDESEYIELTAYGRALINSCMK